MTTASPSMRPCRPRPSTGTSHDGVRDIVIEERGSEEVRFMTGWDEGSGQVATIRICPANTPAANYGFDVTPARLVTGILTERGIAKASVDGSARPVTMRRDEGYIKFSFAHEAAPASAAAFVSMP